MNRPSLVNLPTWLYSLQRAPLKPDQKLTLLKTYLLPKLYYGFQNPRITGRTLRDADRLVKGWVKRVLHLSTHTPDPYLYASVRDGGLGITDLRHAIPRTFLGHLSSLLRLVSLDNDSDRVLSAVLQCQSVSSLMQRLHRLSGEITPSHMWRQRLSEGPTSAGLEGSSQDYSSRAWVERRPNGWTGRDYVRAVQLRTNNLPTTGLIYKPADQRRCRAGCCKIETISHVLQGCPATHWERIRRHNDVVKKVYNHARRVWEVEAEPHVRHTNGVLFKPDLVIHQADNKSVIADVAVCWEGTVPLEEAWERKRRVYDNVEFREAAARRWPGRELIFSPLIVGARGVWPRSSQKTADLLRINSNLKKAIVAGVVKWGCTIHAAFGRKVFRGR